MSDPQPPAESPPDAPDADLEFPSEGQSPAGLPDGLPAGSPAASSGQSPPDEPAAASGSVAAPPGQPQLAAGDARFAGWSTGFQPLDRRHVTTERIGNLVFSAILAVVAIAVLVGLAFRGIDWIWWTVLGGSGAVVLASVLIGVWWPAVAHRHQSWQLDETGLEIRRGVFWRHWISIPLARLQHADVSQGPLQRQFGLARLTVYTAGTDNASVELAGLAHETAIWLRDQLMRQRRTADVV